MAEAIILTLEDVVHISRGDVIVKGKQVGVSDSFSADVVWMNEAPLEIGKEYLFKVGTKSSYGRIVGIKHSFDVNTMAHHAATELKLNEVALVDILLNSSVVFDRYKDSRGTGGFEVDLPSVIDDTFGLLPACLPEEQYSTLQWFSLRTNRWLLTRFVCIVSGISISDGGGVTKTK